MERIFLLVVRPATHALKGLYHTYNRGLIDFKNPNAARLKCLHADLRGLEDLGGLDASPFSRL